MSCFKIKHISVIKKSDIKENYLKVLYCLHSRRLFNISISACVPKSIKIAIIDDNKDYLFLTSKFLSISNKDIIFKTYLTPEKFLDDYFSQYNQFDGIISDFNMENYSGLDLLAVIRQTSKTIPFALYSGFCIQDVKTKAEYLGVNSCIVKDANNREMFSKLNEFLSQSFYL